MNFEKKREGYYHTKLICKLYTETKFCKKATTFERSVSIGVLNTLVKLFLLLFVFWFFLLVRGFGFLCIFSYYSISSNNHKLLWKRLTQFHATGLFLQLFHDACPYHIETSPLICRTNQWIGFYMIRTSVMKELTPLKNIFGSVIFSEGSVKDQWHETD